MVFCRKAIFPTQSHETEITLEQLHQLAKSSPLVKHNNTILEHIYLESTEPKTTKRKET